MESTAVLPTSKSTPRLMEVPIFCGAVSTETLRGRIENNSNKKCIYIHLSNVMNM